jgi:hypothetical protein
MNIDRFKTLEDHLAALRRCVAQLPESHSSGLEYETGIEEKNAGKMDTGEILNWTAEMEETGENSEREDDYGDKKTSYKIVRLFTVFSIHGRFVVTQRLQSV